MFNFKRFFIKNRQKEIINNCKHNHTKENLHTYTLNKLSNLFIEIISEKENIDKKRYKVYNIIPIYQKNKHHNHLNYKYICAKEDNGSVVLLKQGWKSYHCLRVEWIEKIYDKETMIEYILENQKKE